MGLRQVVAHREACLELQPGARGLGDRLAVDLHPHVPGAREDVHARVGVARVGEDFLVLLEPGIHRIPVEADRLAELLDRRLLVTQGGAGGLFGAGAPGVGGGVAAAGGVGTAAVRLEQLAADVREREVVGRVVRLLPDEQRPRGIGHDLAAEIRAHPLGALLDPDSPAGFGGLRCAHEVWSTTRRSRYADRGDLGSGGAKHMAVDLVIDVENTPGALARVAAAISDAGVNIAAATCVGPGERAQLHILVPHAEAVKHALAIPHLAVTREREVVVIDVEDRPGVLADLTRKVARAGVDLDLVYVATRNRVVFGATDIDALRAALA